MGTMALALSQTIMPNHRRQELTIPKRRAPGPAQRWRGAHKLSLHTGLFICFLVPHT